MDTTFGLSQLVESRDLYFPCVADEKKTPLVSSIQNRRLSNMPMDIWFDTRFSANV